MEWPEDQEDGLGVFWFDFLSMIAHLHFSEKKGNQSRS